MAKREKQYVCSDCGWDSSKWLGQCRNCGAWGTLQEFVPPIFPGSGLGGLGGLSSGLDGLNSGLSGLSRGLGSLSDGLRLSADRNGANRSNGTLSGDSEVKSKAGSEADLGFDDAGGTGGAKRNTGGAEDSSALGNGSMVAGLGWLPANWQPALPVTEIDINQMEAASTGIGEFDRVLGRGLVPGAVILLAGEPGVGKSTLLLDVAARFARGSSNLAPRPVLYVTGEESIEQVRLRAERISALSNSLFLTAESRVEAVLAHVQAANPQLIVVDSAQTLTCSAADGAAGSVSQVKAVATMLTHAAKSLHVPLILVGHVTKDGAVAGPRTLEHLVDVVCQFEGDRHTSLRLLRAIKNRYGPTDEIGCFTMSETGIVEIPDPSNLFLSDAAESIGSAITVTLEGHRPLLTEIQALVAPSNSGTPRRTTVGVDSSRVTTILAVLQTHLGVDLSGKEVYVATVGGAKANQPATDLPIALAVLSAAYGRPLPSGLVACGEIGLTSDIRTCAGIPRRLQEAARLGYTKALIPQPQTSKTESKGSPTTDIETVSISSLRDAIQQVFT